MPEIPTAHPGAPLTIWLRPRTERDPDGPVLWYQTLLHDEPDAVEYVRKDGADALVFAMGSHQRVLRAALEALEDGDAAGAEQILRRCLSGL